ncbi:unnamed protein product [Porites lobata]|uniref:Gamma-butyrobetaine dioxygenase n=1 Tax=Porites lobata TaxID=104759 RepID=A0ABN8MP53_9CNID|nr:unnamed protein product [Porites lobata]
MLRSVLYSRTSVTKSFSSFLRRKAQSTYSVTDVKPLVSGNCLQIDWKDGHTSTFHSCWLRLCCQCDKCKQSSSGQRTINVSSLPDPIKLSSFSISENKQNLLLAWDFENDHQGVLNLKWLRENCYSEPARKIQCEMRRTQPHLGQHNLPEVKYSEMMETKEGLWKMLCQLSDHGMSLVKQVPIDDEETVRKVARRMGPLHETIYGLTFNVLTVPNPITIAYSDVELALHSDLVYYESPPGLQFLHCLRFDPEVEGGESIFVDAFEVAKDLRNQFPDDFNNLVRIPATFQKIHFERDYPVKLVYKRPHVVLNPDNEIVAVNWSPDFEGPLFVPEADVKPYFKAYRRFTKLLDESTIKKTVTMQPGDLICFNNRRVLHGRNSFKLNGGVRFLKGCYVNIDEFRNTFQVMSELMGSYQPCKRIGNQCFL